MKKIKVTIIFCLVSFSLFSQTSKIENTRVIISQSMDTMYVIFDFAGKREAFITLEVTDQNNLSINPKNISGDIGKGIKPGKDKTILWDMNADGLDLSGSSLKVKVIGDVFIPIFEKKIKYTPPKWGCAWDCSGGYGIFTGDLSKTFRYIIPIITEGDVCYKRLDLYLRGYLGFTKTVIDVPYSGGIWAKGSTAEVYLYEASLGYVLAETKLIKFAPFAGIAATDIGPPKSDLNKIPGLKQVELQWTTTYALGLNLDFKLKTSLEEIKNQWGYVFIRVRYSYNITQFDNKYTGFGGSIHNLSLGIGEFFPIHKRYY